MSAANWRPRTTALLALLTAAPTTACVRHRQTKVFIDTDDLVELDGFRPGMVVRMRDLDGARVKFTEGTTLTLSGPGAGTRVLRCQRIEIEGTVLRCHGQPGFADQTVDLATTTVAYVPGQVSTETTGVTYVGLGLATLTVIFGWAAMQLPTGGRPLHVPGRPAPVRAALVMVDDRRGGADRRRCAGEETTRTRIAAHWAAEASAECASIPAFLALARDLRRAGAPASLVRAAQHAAREEATHTRLCTAMASRHAGATIHAITPTVPEAVDADHAALLERIALESLWDGCVAEGAAAAGARRSARRARDGAARDALEVIARDEAGHSALARDILAFCRSTGGRRVRHALGESIERRRAPEETRLDASTDEPSTMSIDRDVAQAHGVPDAGTVRGGQLEAWETSMAMLGRA